MLKISITDDEKYLLGQYFKTSPLRLLRLKAQAILMRNKNMKTRDISDLLFRDARTVERWIKDFSEIRMASIFTGHKDNENAAKLTKAQKEEIKETLEKPPSDYGLGKEFWDVPSLKEYVQAEFGTVYESKQSYHFLLKFSNLSFKYPDKFDIKRDESEIAKRMVEIRNEIEPYLNDDNWAVFASDETRIIWEAITRKAWLKKGEKTVIKVERKRDYQNYIGFLDQKNNKCNLYELDWQNQEEILKAFEKLLNKYPKKRICIVWDNARFHKGIKIREALKKGNLLERVHLISMPPYAPDMNPIEHVWQKTKQDISNIQFKDFENTKEAFSNAIQGQTFAYKI